LFLGKEGWRLYNEIWTLGKANRKEKRGGRGCPRPREKIALGAWKKGTRHKGNIFVGEPDRKVSVLRAEGKAGKKMWKKGEAEGFGPNGGTANVDYDTLSRSADYKGIWGGGGEISPLSTRGGISTPTT